jgi:hypothetical protein
MTDDTTKAYQATSTPDGWLAVGHRTTGSPVPGGRTQHLDYQAPMTPAPGADLATVYGNEGPIASSIRDHQGRARVQVLDQARAASPGMFGQLGVNAPGGIAPQPAPSTAPSGTGQEFRQSPHRPAGPPARHYQHQPGELQGPPVGNDAA